jgi:hypothetical protein
VAVFRLGEGRTPPRREESTDEVLAAAERAFGRLPDEATPTHVVIDGIELAYDPAAAPHFVVVPQCDQCGSREIVDFPLEEWTLLGTAVRGQAKTTCRTCRFWALGGSDGRRHRG